ncbi:MAG TPA: glycosyl transferase family protein [Sphingomonas sp.]|nr:glycosyl transferase family protein [Sphingomonas sp.]
MDWGSIAWGFDTVAREAMLFAGVGFLIGGVDDLAVDMIFLVRAAWRRATVMRRHPRASLADFGVADDADRLVVFVAAWDESRVIGAMLATALARIAHPNYRLYVGTYPNDRATIDAVADVAARDSRVRLVIGPNPGPTTKADCLNTLWRALLRDEATDGARAKAVVIHDAEDVVHVGELAIFDRLIDRHWVVQLPVLPLPDRRSRLVSGHYQDEFAETHAKALVVREALGAGLPLAGVGCAIARAALDAIAASRGGAPFDETSLTEDYELGLQVAALGGSGILARVPERPGGPVVAVRAYFPATLEAAIRQKTRWLLGIALAGWDRTGWGCWRNPGELWMRMRDRRAPIATLVLAAGYLALAGWGVAAMLHWLTGVVPPPLPPALRAVLAVNALLLAWRLTTRACFTGLAYGWREALWSLPRAFVGNLIAMLAMRRAIIRYAGMLAGRAPCWDKTAHHFPADIAADRPS